MLDLGFLPDVETIIAATPEHRQTMLFSATMPKAVVGLARRYARRPTFVHAEPEGEQATVHRIGRTGRAGAAGVAVTFAAWNELDTVDLIRRRLELTDEPVHEVYSTSPLLSELFDLPSVEDAAAARAAAAPARAEKPEKAEKAEASPGEEPARRRSRSAARRRRRRRIPAGERPSAATG
jgi:superfamily II DNA/RNA helicase